MSIEFRIEGKESDLVGNEFATLVRTKFGVKATLEKLAPNSPSQEQGGPVRGGFVEFAVLVVHIAIVAHAAYERYVQEPHDKAVAKWQELVFFAKEKRPTVIRAVVGNESLVLDKSDPERLYEFTRKGFDDAIVTTD
jgi:hypothetical protein